MMTTGTSDLDVSVGVPIRDVVRCDCSNPIDPREAEAGATQCEWCAFAATQPPHVGHVAHFTGAWWCDTCNSPYCDLL
jgi:hypothetical protein